MKLRLVAVGLIVVGVGAVVLTVVGVPNPFASSSTKYVTAQASVGTVSATAVANGTVAANTVYGLTFGASPDIVSSVATTSGSSTSSSGNSTSSSGGSGGSSVTWPVMTVGVTIGQSVKKGDVLATADDSYAKLALASAQANLAAAQARLASDKQGADAITIAQAKAQVTQAQNSYNQAVANKSLTNKQNALTLSQAQDAVTAAQQKLDADTAGGAPQSTIDADQAALDQAQLNLESTQLKVDQSNQQAAQQVTNAKLSLDSAKLQYQAKLAPAGSATVLSDQVQVDTAQIALDSAQAAVDDSSIVAPADGLITAVEILPGMNAPSGYAIQLAVGPMVATASFTESQITSLKVGLPASVSVTAASATVAGTVTQIAPSAATTGGASSVVTYSVVVTMTDAPSTVLSGMSATVTVTTASVDNALRVPATALQGSASSGYSVEVMGSDGKLTSQSVEVGLVTTSWAQITSGLQEGQAVVVGTSTSRTGASSGGGGVNLGGLTGGQGGFGR
jgi:HlyD family secretion protein